MRDLSDIHFPEAKQIRIVLDNPSTHTAAALYRAFPPAEAAASGRVRSPPEGFVKLTGFTTNFR
jgi:hypothetical protein